MSDTLRLLDEKINTTRLTLAQLENARQVLKELEGDSGTQQAATPARSAPKARRAKPKARAKAQPKANETGEEKPFFSPTEPTIKEKIISTLSAGDKPLTSQEIIEKTGDLNRKPSYWSALSDMAKKKEVIKMPDKTFKLPPQQTHEMNASTN